MADWIDKAEIMIPDWDAHGILPPRRPGQSQDTQDRSPYKTSLAEVVRRFAGTRQRRHILLGLLQYRQALHQHGIASGFQWIDGSFTENVEVHEDRSPNDVDVVTFFNIPPGETQQGLLARVGGLFEQEFVRKTYRVDAYLHPLGVPLNERRVRQISYWYSMWSHRRDGRWKGFVQLPLAENDEYATMSLLQENIREGGAE